MTYLFLFWQSNLLEWPIYLSKFSDKSAGLPKNWRWWKSALFITVMNSMTHPIVFFGFMNLPLPYLANILLAEVFAITAETFILKKFLRMTWWSSLLTSLLANLLSWQIAPMLTYSLFQPK
jgi:hypothetical protein